MSWNTGTGEHFIASNPASGPAPQLSAMGIYNVKDPAYGAKGDGQRITNGAMGSGSAVLTSASGKFAVTDVTKQIAVAGAGASGVWLYTTILSYQSATQVTLAASNASGGAISSKQAVWGTDDTMAIQAALDAARLAGGGTVYFPAGIYDIYSRQTGVFGILPGSNTWLLGAGKGVTTLFQGFDISLNGIGGNFTIGNYDTVAGNSFIYVSDMTVETEPVRFTASPNLTQYGVGIYFQGVSDMQIERVRFLNCAGTNRPLPAVVNTSSVHTTGKSNRCKVTYCDFDSGAAAWNIVQSTDVEIRHCQAINIYDSSFAIQSSGERISLIANTVDGKVNTFAALALLEFTNDGAGDSNGIRDVVVEGNVLLNHLTYATKGIQFQGVSHGTIHGNVLRGIPDAGIWLNSSCQNIAISGNTIVGCVANAGIRLVNDGSGLTRLISIVGNTIQGCSTGIYSGSGPSMSGILISGNTGSGNGANGDIRMDLGVTANTGYIGGNVLQSGFFINGAGWTIGPNAGLLAAMLTPKTAISTGQTAAVASLVTVPTITDGAKHTYRVSGVVNITTHGTESINLQVTYTDDGGTARTATITLSPIGGTDATAANAAGPWTGAQTISVNPSTTITMLTAGTFTGATYNVAGCIELLS